MVHRPAKECEAVIPVPRLTVVVVEDGLDAMVHLPVQLPHTSSVSEKDVAVTQQSWGRLRHSRRQRPLRAWKMLHREEVTTMRLEGPQRCQRGLLPVRLPNWCRADV